GRSTWAWRGDVGGNRAGSSGCSGCCSCSSSTATAVTSCKRGPAASTGDRSSCWSECRALPWRYGAGGVSRRPDDRLDLSDDGNDRSHDLDDVGQQVSDRDVDVGLPVEIETLDDVGPGGLDSVIVDGVVPGEVATRRRVGQYLDCAAD